MISPGPMGGPVERLSAFDVAGRVALVTGSSRGIGRAFVEALAAAGCRVVVHGRDQRDLDEVARSVTGACGVEAFGLAFDLTDPVAIASAVDRIQEVTGGVDILVNNAGVQHRAPFLDFPLAKWDEIIAANLTSAFLVAQHVARGMAARGRGSIVNVGSVQSRLARPGVAPYAVSKSGIVMLTRAMCAELACHGIQVNALAPGYVATDMTASLREDPAFDDWVRSRTPAGRWGDVTDLLGPLLFLVSDAARYVNGQVLYVDGGMTAVV